MSLPALLAVASLTEVSPGLIAWTIITFVVLMLVLKRTTWGPILSLVEEREKAIVDAVDAAKRERAEAEKLLAEQKSAIADARREAAEMMAKNRDEVERFRQDLMAQSKKEADALLTQARQQIDDERVKAVAQVKAQAVELVLAATAKLVGQSVDDAKHRQLVNEYIATLPSETRS